MEDPQDDMAKLVMELEAQKAISDAARSASAVMVEFIAELSTLVERYVGAVGLHAVAHSKTDEERNRLAGVAYEARAQMRQKLNAARAAAFLEPLPRDFMTTEAEVLGFAWEKGLGD